MQAPLPNEPHEHRRGQRLLFVGVLFAVLLSFPMLSMVDKPVRVAGVPVLYLYMLLLWLVLVGVTGWLVRSNEQ
ncbi:hypothetical protein [Hymenobacter koreensis]|uniref:DUF3311 domain-containing protein n=1 Tax=Hymenobacter koreensis TaxID=1084523 RepID=A0ABP8J987_9BACT